MPSQCSGRVDGAVEDGRLDGVDRPAVGEGRSDLAFGDTAWPPVPRLAIAEAEHVAETARAHYRCQPVDEPPPPLVVEAVEEPAVEQGVELCIQLGQTQRVEDKERRLQAPGARLLLCKLYCPGCDVNAERFVAEGRREQGVLAGPAAHVEHAANETAWASRAKAGCGRPMSHGAGVEPA